jgi:hypothetical protein
MRKLANPPAAIKLVLEAVCVALGVKPAKVGLFTSDGQTWVLSQCAQAHDNNTYI